MAKKTMEKKWHNLFQWCRCHPFVGVGDFLWSASWGAGAHSAGRAGVKEITGFGKSCVVMRCKGAMEHIVHDAPPDVRLATPEEIKNR